MSGAVEVNLREVLRSIASLDDKAQKALDAAVMEVALTIERETKLLLNNNPHRLVSNSRGKGQHWEPRDHIGPPGSPPNRRSGNLMRSTRARPVRGFRGFAAEVGPGVIYGRRLEVSKNEGGFGYPYLRPTVDRIRPRASRIAVQAFLRKWRG